MCFSYNKTEAQFLPVSRPCKFDLESNRGENLKNKHPKTGGEETDPITLSTIQTNLPSITLETLLSTPENHILFFWTASAFFAIDEPPRLINTQDFRWEKHYFRDEDPRSHLRCRKTGKVVGSMDNMGPTHWRSIDKTIEAWEFVRLGHVQLDAGSPVTILALQIRWEDGVAYRMNLAEIEEVAWDEALPIQKLVALG